MISLRRLLLVALLGTIGVATCASTWLSYRNSLIEANELFDAKLAQSARVLSALSEDALARDPRAAPLDVEVLDRALEGRGDELATADGHAYETKLAFQVLDPDGAPLMASGNAPREPLAPLRRGFGARRIDGREWRTFALRSGRGHWFLVAERSDIRDELAAEIALGTALPQVLALPLLAALVVAIVAFGTRALSRVASEVERRPADRLDAIDAVGAPRELQGLVRALNGLFERVRAAIEREQRFTADAAHELRTPISALKLHAQNLAASEDAEQRQASLDGLLRGVRRCERLVSQLLVLARLEAGGEGPALRAVELARLARETIAELAPEALERDIEIVLDAPVEVQAAGDPLLLGVLLRNLVENAIRHGDASTELVVRIRDPGGRPELQVDNRGPRLSPEARARVFERFHRQEGTAASGSGLGLSIARRIAELHGADLQLLDLEGASGVRASLRLAPATGQA